MDKVHINGLVRQWKQRTTVFRKAKRETDMRRKPELASENPRHEVNLFHQARVNHRRVVLITVQPLGNQAALSAAYFISFTVYIVDIHTLYIFLFVPQGNSWGYGISMLVTI